MPGRDPGKERHRTWVYDVDDIALNEPEAADGCMLWVSDKGSGKGLDAYQRVSLRQRTEVYTS